MNKIIKILLSIYIMHIFVGCGNLGNNEQLNTPPTSQPFKNNIPQNIPDVSSSSAQLQISFQNIVNPSSVTGYIVGKKDLLTIEKTTNDEYFINNIPAGKHDIILLGTGNQPDSNLTSFMNLFLDNSKEEVKEEPLGIRLKDVEFLNGVRTKKEKVKLTKLVSVTGRAELINQIDNAGIRVYIPGTSYIAMTATDGSFSFSGVPVGIHNFYFEKDGYYRGQFEGISLEPNSKKQLNSVKLAVDTGTNGLITLADGASEINSLIVPITISASQDAIVMKISEDINFIGKSWIPVSSAIIYTFESPGEKTLYVKFANANGLETSPYIAKILVKFFPTINQIKIANGANSVNSRDVPVEIEIPINAKQMKVSEFDDFSAAIWLDLNKTFNFTFSNVGLSKLYVKFKNTDGFESPVYISNSLNILIFGEGSGSVLINNGSDTTTSRTVNLTITKPSNATFMKISEFSTFSGAVWIDVVPTKSFTFLGEGNKIVYIKFKDSDNFESSVWSDRIIVDLFTDNDGAVIINNDDPISNSRTVDLVITKPLNATSMKISEFSNFSDAEWIDIVQTKSFTFLGEGNKIVYIKFRDSDNFESSVWSDGIIVDLFGDNEGNILINNNDSSTNNSTVSLSITKPLNASFMIICESNAFLNCTWENAVTTKSYTFALDGVKTLYIKFKDHDGFESPTWSDGIILDLSAPSFTVSSSYTGRGANMTINTNVTDDSDVTLMKIAKDTEFDSALWETFSATKSIPYSKNIKIQLKDSLGNASEISNYTVNYTATLSQARSQLVATSVGTKAIFAAGYINTGNSVSNSSVVDIYDSDTNMWSTASLSEAKLLLAATTVGTKAIFATGGDGDAYYSTIVDIYDSVTNTWSSTTTSLPEGKYWVGVTSIGTKAFFAGGYHTSEKNTVNIYDSITNSWSTDILSMARRGLIGATIETKAIFAGGVVTGVGLTTLVDIYNSTENTWSTANLSQARQRMAATSVGNKAVFAGGDNNASTVFNTVDIYNSLTNQWSTASLSQARFGIAAAAVGTKAIFAGGRKSIAPYIVIPSNVVDIYDSATNTWSTATLSVARYDLAATTVGTKVIFAGGIDTTDYVSNVVDIYDSVTNTWSTGM